MINQQIIDYIKQQMQQGVSQEQIKNSLMANGWQLQDIEENFNKITSTSNTYPSVPVVTPNGNWKNIVIAVIVVVVLGGGTYFASQTLSKPKESNKISNEISNQPPTETVPPIQSTEESTAQIPKLEEKPQALGPKESWLKMKAEADNIKSYADLEVYTLKYGSKEQIAKLTASKQQIDSLSQSFKDQIVTMAKGPLSSDITTIQETTNGNTATLNVQTSKSGLVGVITLVLQDNQWKLQLESWKQK
jgi:hypothetical protein